jgi:hypothetical protein
MHTSRTGPTININTARTSSEANRVNIPSNLYSQTIQFNGNNRQSQEKLPNLIPISKAQVVSIPPNSLIKQEPMGWQK